MSILDGHVVLDNEVSRGGNNKNQNQGKNNGSGKRKNNFKNNFNQRRTFGESSELDFSGSSYFPEEERGKTYSNEEQKTDERANAILDFCESFANNTDNYRSLQDIIVNDFPDVITYIKSYYSSKNSPEFQGALNKLVKIICTTPFAKLIGSVLESGVWNDDGTYGRIWDSIGFGISIALETNHDRMHTDAIRKYVLSIIPRMYKTEINSIRTQTGVTGYLAVDLIIAIPVISSDWTNTTLDAFYNRFLDKMLIHAEDNMDILNWEVQGTLYEIFFGKSKDALKVIGKYLSNPEPELPENEVVVAVYDEFKKMLYSKLDNYDIDDIQYVMSFVAKTKRDNPDKQVMFKFADASKYENVKKGLISVLDKDSELGQFLA